MSCLDAAVEAWVQECGSVPLPKLLDAAMAAVHPLTTPADAVALRRTEA
ncbi:hypothetical protein ACFV23_08825 [Streptomyces sp. NPDC059627]